MHKYLPKYFIFMNEYNKDVFKYKNIDIGIIYRNYKDKRRENQLIKIAKECKKNRYQLFVSNNIKLAHKVKADGIYVPSFNKTQRFSNLEKKNIKILGSAHNQKEIRTKILQNCEIIFLSPLFRIKKSKTFLGVYKYNYLSIFNKVSILPLGGFSKKNIKKLKLLKAQGFGGMNIFKKKPALKMPVLIKKNFF
jgi:thiamine-phosphate pyrophosphorylase